MIVALALATIAVGWILLLYQVDPVPTWFYVIAWYPTLVVLDRLSRPGRTRESLFRRPTRVLSVFGWSAIIWLVFEAFNLRLRNWYYVFLPDNGVERWIGILVSFATVVPALVLAERLLFVVGVGHSWRTAPLRVGRRDARITVAVGGLLAGLALTAPHNFFALVWVALWLLADPFVLWKQPQWSLLGDLARGEWGRIGRLMIGGLGIGVLWEFYNSWARGKWIYTVPWLEQTKLFEMPPLGFIGFAFFALEAWAIYHALCVLGLAVPLDGSRSAGNGSSTRRAGAVIVAAVFGITVLAGMERRTVSSVTPRLEKVPAITVAETQSLRAAGVDTPFDLARADPDSVAQWAGVDRPRARLLVEAADLTVLRGIGTEHARVLETIGVRTTCALARRSPAVLWHAIQEVHATGSTTPRDGPARRPTAGEVRVWVGAARRACIERGGIQATDIAYRGAQTD